jgi:hypothetical protein
MGHFCREIGASSNIGSGLRAPGGDQAWSLSHRRTFGECGSTACRAGAFINMNKFEWCKAARRQRNIAFRRWNWLRVRQLM